MILVDELVSYPWKPYTTKGKVEDLWCDMVSDRNLEELHVFAAELGLRRTRYNSTRYSLRIGKRKYALKMGAIEVDRILLLKRMIGGRNRPAGENSW